jgi:signal transduction histidine kinase
MLTIHIENECHLFTEEVLSKIWDRFYKADTSHNRDTEGTGLGLAITKSILEGHDSPYGVHTTDLGICFYFTMEAI